MPIALNFHLGLRNAEDGTVKPFGKVGYQTMHAKLDKYTRANLARIEKDLLAGKLMDLDGNVVDNHAVIDVYCTVSRVNDSDTIEAVPSYRNSAGSTVESDPETESDEPDF